MYLEGGNIAPKNSSDAKKLVGKNVWYLCKDNIDRSGRGYFFPRSGVIETVTNKNLIISNGNTLYLNDIVEMVEIQSEEELT